MGVHKRENYENLLERLIRESNDGFLVKGSIDKTSDYNLLLQINNYLKKLGCIQYTQDELNEISLNMD